MNKTVSTLLVPQTALIVEDDTISATILSAMLKSLSIDAKSVSNWEEAFDMLVSDYYHYAFIDYRLHGRTGAELCEMLQYTVHPKNSDLKVILVSASLTQAQTEIKYRHLNLHGMIEKPISLSAIKHYLVIPKPNNDHILECAAHSCPNQLTTTHEHICLQQN